MTVDRRWQLSLRVVALTYLGALLFVPVGLIFYRTFEHGFAAVWESITTPAAIHAFQLTLEVTIIAVPLNTLFGIVMAIALARGRWRGKGLVNAFIDLPFAVSPIVIGLSLVLVYGVHGWFGGALANAGIQVIFSVPGIVLATIFVSLPFVVREVTPVLKEIGDDQEQAAATLGAGAWTTFRRVTLPAIRWGVAYGVVLCTARVLGEFGAVSIVSGHITGETQTLPLFVEKNYENFNLPGAFGAAVLLALLALVVLMAMNLLKRKEAA